MKLFNVPLQKADIQNVEVNFIVVNCIDIVDLLVSYLKCINYLH